MATTLYLLDTVADTHLGTNNLGGIDAGNAAAWTSRALGTSRGSGVVASTATATATLATDNIQPVQVGGVACEWISPPVAADVTISGTVTMNVWASESNMSANIFPGYQIFVIRANALATSNSNTNVRLANAVGGGVEAAVTTRGVLNNTIAGLGVTVNKGDRIRVVVSGAQATSAATFTWNIGYNGTTASVDGDTWVSFAETITFSSAPAGSQLFLTNVQSGLSYGTPVAPSLVSDFTGSDENPLSEGGNWANINSSGNPLQRISNAASATSTGVQAAYWTPANFGPDLEAYLTISTISGGQHGIFARIQGEGGAATWDGYGVQASNSTSAITRFTNAAQTTIASSGPAFASGDKIGMRIDGSKIQLWKLPSGGSVWNLMLSVEDTTYASAGKIGIYCSNTTGRIDDFYAGTDTNLFTADAPALISDFTGADENPLSEGGNWNIINTSSPTHVLKRISNSVTGVTGAGTNISYWTPANFGPDLDAYFTIGTLAGAVGIVARIQGEGGAGTWDGYRCYATSSDTSIDRYTNAVLTTLVSTGVGVFATGDKFGVRLEGSTIQIWRQASGSSDWNLVVTAVDATYTSAGKIGIFASLTTSRIDDFYAATDSNLFTQKAWTSRGAGVVSYRSDTDLGWTAPLYTTEWFTPELEAFTLTGMAQANIRALESNASANASLRCQIARVESDGTSPTVWASWCCAPTGTDNGELTTSEVARTINVSGDDLAFTDGQRLRIRLYNEDISSAAMANAFNVQPFFNGTSAAASGDSYVTLAQSVTEFSGGGPVTYEKAGYGKESG